MTVASKISLGGRIEVHERVLKVFRVLIADLVQNYGGGHPGGAMGMAAIGIALWKYVMKYAPSNPDFFNRDRFVLSNGHTCLFQYVFHHLVGYEHMTMEQLRSYHSTDLESFCPGHPENEHPGIEVTTGPLGQGVANAVGLAIASKNMQGTYNRPGYSVISNHTFCMVGDACLQEGIALEAISLAGHLGLNNLTVIYDNNQVSCDGSVDLTNTEKINEKFKACNWNVIEVEDGCYDVERIVIALETAKCSSDNPTLVNIHTSIGVGSNVEGKAEAHGAAFGEKEVDRLHTVNGFKKEDKFYVPGDVYNFFEEAIPRGERIIQEWNDLVVSYGKEHPDLAEDFLRRVRGKLPKDWERSVPEFFPSSPTASRKSSGLVINLIAKEVNNFFVGSADLSPSVNLIWQGKKDFQNPRVKVSCGINGDYSGRYMHYGIREHAMAGIANGIAAFNEGTFIPVTSSFFMFYLYAAPAVRYGALSKLKVIHVATHDSIGTGEDGPTHQPIELAALYRSMPNINYIRPCDSEETAGAWEIAIKSQGTPTIISLSRQSLPQYPGMSNRSLVKKGAYVFQEMEDAVLNLIGVGAELNFSVEAAKILNEEGIKTRVISFPSQNLFELQSGEYKRSILKRGKIPTVVVEAFAPNGWERYATAGINMKTYGKSLPGATAYEYFGFNSMVIATKVKKYLSEWNKEREICYEFCDLN